MKKEISFNFIGELFFRDIHIPKTKDEVLELRILIDL
jgi:hypothetical protein